MARIFIQTLMVFGLSMITGHFALPVIKKVGLRQVVREDGPATHFVKTGTPTFGGLFFLIPYLFVFLLRLFTKKEFDDFQVSMLLIFAFAVIGFWDDYTKVKVNKEGISVKQKSLALGLASSLFALSYLFFSGQEILFRLPLGAGPLIVTGFWKGLYFIFITLYLFFMANAVNISDGVDGLCSSLVFISSLALIPALYRIDKEGMMPLIELCLILAVGVLAFLFYNRHPAKIFMGDTGSLALGAGLAVIALLAGFPWLMLFHGLVFILEGLSSLLQTLYFKRTKGKRLFRMAPLHHHFELGGWSEQKVVIVFSAVGLLAGIFGILVV